MTAQELFSRVWEMLIGRVDGPFTLRLFLQPTMAVLFAIRSGWRDAREGRTPFLITSLFTGSANRSEMLGKVRKDVGKIFFVALMLDLLYEWKVYHWVYPGQAVIVAAVLAIVPYLVICGPVSRVMRRYYGSKTR